MYFCPLTNLCVCFSGKLQALAKELKEKERQERIKNREKSEGSSDVSNCHYGSVP